MAAFPTPTGGASLILSFHTAQKVILIVGSGPLAASRAFSALEADANVIVLARGGVERACEELKWRAEQKQLVVQDLSALPGLEANGSDQDAEALDAYLCTLTDVSLLCVTDTPLGPDPAHRRSTESATRIASVCRARKIPVNVSDHPDLCDFTFTSTHRFIDNETGLPSPLQIGVTTNGQGCRLAGRLRRELISKLPKESGGAAVKVGKLRALSKDLSASDERATDGASSADSEPTPNAPVPQRSSAESAHETARRRMRWVAQVSEYWPIPRLASMSPREMQDVLEGDSGLDASSPLRVGAYGNNHHPGDSEVNSLHILPLVPTPPPGRIFLVGSGPGHPSLLTLATHNALTRHADLVLSDKLVPTAVLEVIPSGVEVKIARKFPGNADEAQAELMEAAVEAARRGLTVVRVRLSECCSSKAMLTLTQLKQGDPSVYGRAGEEVLYFRAQGYEPIVIPGVSSVLAGPTFAGIPVTQRGAAESFMVCTGVGRQGKEVKLPGYERSRTLVILMGVARLPQVLDTLLSDETSPARRSGPAYPPHLPIAVIERASMPDQRVVCTTLESIVAAMESIGEQRPPGMIVVGWSILSLWGKGDVTVLDEDAETVDNERIWTWLGDARWRVTEGLAAGWDVV